MVKEIQIPTSLDEIKLSQLISLGEVEQNNKDAIKNHVFTRLLGIPKKMYLGMNYNDTEEIFSRVSKVFHQPLKERLKFEMDGVSYGRIPNLDTITGGEYFDLDMALKSVLDEEKPELKKVYDFMRVLWRPIREEVKGIYSIVPYSDIEHIESIIFKDAPSDVYLTSRAFFLLLKRELLNHTQKSLKEAREVMSKNPPMTNLSKEDGDGLDTLITWLKEMSQSGMKSQINPYIGYFQNLHSTMTEQK